MAGRGGEKERVWRANGRAETDSCYPSRKTSKAAPKALILFTFAKKRSIPGAGWVFSSVLDPSSRGVQREGGSVHWGGLGGGGTFKCPVSF